MAPFPRSLLFRLRLQRTSSAAFIYIFWLHLWVVGRELRHILHLCLPSMVWPDCSEGFWWHHKLSHCGCSVVTGQTFSNFQGFGELLIQEVVILHCASYWPFHKKQPTQHMMPRLQNKIQIITRFKWTSTKSCKCTHKIFLYKKNWNGNFPRFPTFAVLVTSSHL